MFLLTLSPYLASSNDPSVLGWAGVQCGGCRERVHPSTIIFGNWKIAMLRYGLKEIRKIIVSLRFNATNVQARRVSSLPSWPMGGRDVYGRWRVHARVGRMRVRSRSRTQSGRTTGGISRMSKWPMGSAQMPFRYFFIQKNVTIYKFWKKNLKTRQLFTQLEVQENYNKTLPFLKKNRKNRFLTTN